jgi:hypothetical protein
MKEKILYSVKTGKKKKLSPYRIWIDHHPEYCIDRNCDVDCRRCSYALNQIGPTIKRVPEQFDLFYVVMSRNFQLYIHKDETLSNHPMMDHTEKYHRIIEG